MISGVPPEDRVRTLLLRGDSVLKSDNPERLDRALEAFLEARDVATQGEVSEHVRGLVERRIEETRRQISQRA